MSASRPRLSLRSAALLLAGLIVGGTMLAQWDTGGFRGGGRIYVPEGTKTAAGFPTRAA